MAAPTWYVAPALLVLRAQINALYPGRDKSTDGSIGDAAHNARKSDHNADWGSSPPGIVRALDVDEDLCGPNAVDKGAIAQHLVDAIVTDPRVAYVIYEGRIAVRSTTTGRVTWRAYTTEGKSGWFNPHKMHFHISLRHGTAFERDTSPWPIGTTAVPIPPNTARPIPTPAPDLPAPILTEESEMRIISAPLPWDASKRVQVYVTATGGASTLDDNVAGVLRQNWPSHDYERYDQLETEVREAWARAETAGNVTAAAASKRVLDGLAQRLKD